jgi:hypothetical protein
MLNAAPAQAQATRTWVSGVGDDVNPCSRTAPCKTFAGAISKTAVNGEINCLDPGGFGGVTITKSITIDCHEVYASVLVAGTNGVSIAFDSFAAGDTNKTVRLRNLNFNGSNTGLRGISITGATNTLNSEVHIEDCMIDGFMGSPGHGISDTRVNSGKLFVNNTTIRNNLGVGITINPASGSQVIQASINTVRSLNNGFGLTAGSGTRVMISNSIFAGNNAAGVEAEGPAGASEVNIDNSTLSGNNIGAQNGGTTTIRSSNSNFAFNNTAFSGATSSFGNNRVSGAIGTTPTLIGAASPAFGQQ